MWKMSRKPVYSKNKNTGAQDAAASSKALVQKKSFFSGFTGENGVPVGIRRNISEIRTFGNQSTAIVQMAKGKEEGKRVPTFFTYVHGQMQKSGKMPITLQGPHTVAHKYIDDKMKDGKWDEIFDTQIAPYPPERIEKILVWEAASGFENKVLFLDDYKRMFYQMQTWRLDGTLKRRDNGEIAENTPLYQEIFNFMMCLIEMHPYGSYGWDRSGPDEIADTEISGKSESTIDITRYQDQIDTIVDPHAEFQKQDEYIAFLHTRIPLPEKDSRRKNIDSIDAVRKKAVKDDLDRLMNCVRNNIRGMTPGFGWLVNQLQGLSLESAAKLFDRMPSTASHGENLKDVRDSLLQILILMRHHAADLPKGHCLEQENALRAIASATLEKFTKAPFTRNRIPEKIQQLLALFQPKSFNSEEITAKDGIGEQSAESSSSSMEVEEPHSPAPMSDLTVLKGKEPESSLISANNCLIEAVIDAYRTATGGETISLTEDMICDIRWLCYEDTGAFLEADQKTINAIKDILLIENTVIVVSKNSIQDCFKGDDSLPALYVELFGDHFTALSPGNVESLGRPLIEGQQGF